MSYTNYCDCCGEVIKPKDKKFDLAIKEMIESSEDMAQSITMEEFIKKFKESKHQIQTWEICEKCKYVLDHFFSLRVKEVKKIYKKIEYLFKEGDKDEKNT